MRLAIVVQRYGAEILGGAETLAARMAGILARHHEVEVLTTTAQDYHRWTGVYPPGVSRVAGVLVRRFEVERGRDAGWAVMNRLLHDGFESGEFAALPEAIRLAHAARLRAWPDALQEEFIRGQGPCAPALYAHLAATAYDRVVFVTYLYPTTYDGLAAVPAGRACVVPTLHDEPPAYLPVFGRRLKRGPLLCLTESEVSLVARLYPEDPPEARRLGYGIPLPPDLARPRRASCGAFLLYAGRIDTHKGVPQLLRWYQALRALRPDAPRLVLIGEVAMPLAPGNGVEVRGFVPEEEKLRLMREALALVHLSPFESLGIVALEAMACRTPVLVDARCEVMVEHCRRGGGGIWIRDAQEFAAASLRLAGEDGLRERLGDNGRRFVEAEYSLEAYEGRLLEEFPAHPGPDPGCVGDRSQFTRL